MKTRTLLCTLAFCAIAAVAAFASDPNVGTWKLNEAKSKIAAGAPKNNTVTYTAEGDSYKCVVEGVDGAGAALHNEWTGKFDGKDYALVGDPTADARAIKMTAKNSYSLTNKQGGKPTTTGTIKLSADGKTRTLVTHTKTADGKTSTNTFVYDLQ
jgi:hypothetical protein